jgi:hypothetical protein
MKKEELEERFDADFRFFKRILKDNGKYYMVMNYIFNNGRSMSDFKNAVITLGGFERVLITTTGIGIENYRHFGEYSYWKKNISSIAEIVCKAFEYRLI